MRPLRAFEPTNLPEYLPIIQHGGKRRIPLDAPIVGVPTFKILQWYPGSERLRPIVNSAELLRESFRLRRDCRLILISVAKDPQIEQLWSRYRKDEIATALRELNVEGMTVPNFSFFEDAPYIHNVWNRWRMIRVAETLSAAGIAVIPHLNALHSTDWDYWTGYLQEHPNIRCVVKEFQTGNAKPRYAREAIASLRRLEQRLGRGLHPILVGAGFVLGEAKASFPRFTLADSNPFMKTVNRREFTVAVGGRRKWLPLQIEQQVILDPLLATNLSRYTQWVTAKQSRHFSISEQLTLPLSA
ncbi:MAG TPA: DUF4417 domain-containing protein [Polyangium sp.]|nr:DUF4417 domain-containing protein [Polyangium sp.]